MVPAIALRTMAFTAQHERHPLREDPMKSLFTVDRENAATRNSVRTLVAVLCVLGLVGLTVFHFEDGAGIGNPFAKAAAPAAAGPVADSRFLRAPTSDPSLPSLEATFSHKIVAPADEATAPTF